MNDLSHPADPGFRVILALLRAGIAHKKLGRMLPDWPQALKDRHDETTRAYQEAWVGMWDVFTNEPEIDTSAEPVDGVSIADATAATDVPEPVDPRTGCTVDEPPSKPVA